MIRKALPMLVVVAVVGMVGLLGPSHVAAQQAGISRSLPEASVDPGDQFTVTINNVGFADSFGQVVETLPLGFSYVTGSATDGSVDPPIADETAQSPSGQEVVTFTVVGLDSFRYEVLVGDDVQDGPHTFTGDAGQSSVTVEAGTTTTPPTATTTPPMATSTPPDTTTPGGISRSLPRDPVDPGDQFTVTINNVGFADSFGQVVETLPLGFSYVTGSATDGSVDPPIADEIAQSPSGQEVVTFTVVGLDSFMYEVLVGDDVQDGPHAFTGDAGQSSVTVGAGTTTPGGISRSLPTDPVDPGDQFTVTINNVGFADSFGQVVETLPLGFTYVTGSATDGSVDPPVAEEIAQSPSGQEVVTFTVVGLDSFMYEVLVGDDVQDGPHAFSGDAGQSSVTVGAGTTTPGGISRSLPTDPVDPGDQFTVTINNVGFADSFGQVVETLPLGFSYVTGSATDGSVDPPIADETAQSPSGQEVVTFTVVGLDSFMYEVLVGDDVTDGQHTFTGDAGSSSVTVGPPPRPVPPPRRPSASASTGIANRAPVFGERSTTSRSVDEASASGTNVGNPVTADDFDRDTLAYTLSGADAALFDIDGSTGQITVGSETTLDYETEDTYSVTVTVSDGSGGTDSIEVTIMVTDVAEAPAATPTAMPTAEPTARPTPEPTARPTAVPTARPTAEPTARPTPEPTAMPTAVPTARPAAVPTARPTAVPTARPTAVPPTPRPTAVPPAVVAPTAVPPTVAPPEPTVAPPAPTVAPPAPTVTPPAEEAGGLPGWVIPLIIVVVIGGVAAGFVYLRSRRA